MQVVEFIVQATRFIPVQSTSPDDTNNQRWKNDILPDCGIYQLYLDWDFNVEAH